MQDIMIRIEMRDYEAWLEQHYAHAENRKQYGISDGPVYRDIDTPNAALFHISTEDLDRALQWIASETFKAATQRATVTGRNFYVAKKR